MTTKSNAHAGHVIPLWVYLTVGGGLIVLTGITVGVSFIRLGGWNVVVALGIATLKATLVALFFMHLLYDKKIFLVVFVSAIVFVGIFIIFTMFDTMHRGDIYEDAGQPIKPNAAIYDRMQTTQGDSVAVSHGETAEPIADSVVHEEKVEH
jgi:cytochrome c oxidase subunit 4